MFLNKVKIPNNEQRLPKQQMMEGVMRDILQACIPFCQKINKKQQSNNHIQLKYRQSQVLSPVQAGLYKTIFQSNYKHSLS